MALGFCGGFGVLPVCLFLYFCNFVNYSVKSLRSRYFRIANTNTFKPEASKSEKET